MQVDEIDIDDRREVNAFLALPHALYRGIPQWVPPIASDARRILDRKRNPFFQHSQAAFFLARTGAQVVGRVAMLDNRNYNTFNNERTAFLNLYECAPEAEAAQRLFEAGFAWARRRGLNQVVGPRGFTALDGLGLLIRGFEHRPAMGIPYNPPYYGAQFEAAGFQPDGDIVSGHLDRSAVIPDKIHRLAEIVQRRRGLHIARFRRRADLRTLAARLGELYNNTLGGTPGNVRLTPEEIRTIARQMLLFADPRLVKVVMKGEEMVGFVFAYPDISAAIQRSRGRLLPLGWLDWLRELRRTRWININGAGIVDRYRGLGGTAILFSEMYKTLMAGRYEHADIVQIGTQNENMQRELRDLGIAFHKTHRMYRRGL
ncbi:MAG: hypothetical protein A2Y93_02140 [Chloroflexi bacterium RBG_13_68_17]|nr:MAG: hypothetical protein A2Y93_02140 [Chloroflexi bacterium RBG_13_68_17]